jgi:Zn-finger nucleic acid-binding protein
MGMDAYRDRHHLCPRCNHELRIFGERLVCDACEGLMLSEDDLRTAIEELTGLAPTFALRDEAPGTRPCPHCRVAMTTAKLTIELPGARPSKPGPELDHCTAHGLWFDESELADVLAPIAGKGFGGGTARSSSARDRSDSAAPRRSFTFNLGGRGWAS